MLTVVCAMEERAADAVRTDARNEEIVVGIVDGRLCTLKETCLATFAAQLQFPDYFGNNWDALTDCLRDFPWTENDAVILTLCADEMFLGDDLGFRTLLEILTDVASERQSR